MGHNALNDTITQGGASPTPVHEAVAYVRSLLVARDVKRVRISLLAAVPVLFLTAQGGEILFQFDSVGRAILAHTLGILCAVTALVFLGARPLMRFIKREALADERVAIYLGGALPQLGDRVLNTLQLEIDLRKNSYPDSTEFLLASVEEFGQLLKGVRLNSAVDNAPLRASIRNGIVAAALVLVAWLILPVTMYESLMRIYNWNTPYAKLREVKFEVRPSGGEFVAGEPLDVEVLVNSSAPEKDVRIAEALLYWQNEEETIWNRERMIPGGANRFLLRFASPRKSFTFYVGAAGERSERYLLRAVSRPILRSFYVRLRFPQYTRLPEIRQNEFVGDISAPRGTLALLEGEASESLKAAMITLSNSVQVPLRVWGSRFFGSLTVQRDDKYGIGLESESGAHNRDPVKYEIKAVEDMAPQVKVLVPGRNIEVAKANNLQLLAQIQDDFGFSKLDLAYRLAYSRYEEPKRAYRRRDVPISAPNESPQSIAIDWNLSELSLAPEDIVEYFLEIWDNDAVSGPKSSSSGVYTIRIPSLEEVFAGAENSRDAVLRSVEESLLEAKRIQDELGELDKSLKMNKPLDWQQQNKVKELAERYQKLQDKLKDASKTMEEITSKMDEHRALSTETLQKYEELQRLMKEIDDPAMRQAFQRMQDAMRQVSPEQLRDAMRQMQFSEDRLRQSIERTLELLKRMHIEQKMEELVRRLDRLASDQEQLAKSKGDTAALRETQLYSTETQRQLAQQQEAVEQLMSETVRRMEEFFSEMPAEKLDSLLKSTQSKSLPQKMRTASSKLQRGEMEDAREIQSEIASDLQNAAETAASIRREMLERQSVAVVTAVKKAVEDLLEMSKRQEALAEQSADASDDSRRKEELARAQMQNVSDLSSVLKSLSRISRQSLMMTPEIGRSLGDALRGMSSALAQLNDKAGAPAATEQLNAMTALNRAAVQLRNALGQMMQGGAGGGLMGQMQSLLQQQAGVNKMTADALAEAEALRRAAEMSRVMGQQEAVRKSLEQLRREAEMSGESGRIPGDLNSISAEMKEVVSDIEQQSNPSEIKRKQERILSRLLEASRSLRERDYEKKRTARPGSRIAQRPPIRRQGDEKRNGLFEDLSEERLKKFSKEFRDLIRKYYESLRSLPR